MSLVTVRILGLFERIYERENAAPAQILCRMPHFLYQYLGAFPSHRVPILSNEIYGLKNNQPTKRNAG